MSILSDKSNEHIIAWLPHGNGFSILNKKDFASEILPKFFSRSAKFTSFTRKLNRWGFSRVPRGPEAGSYYHKLFQRGNHRLCTQMSSNPGNKYTPHALNQQLLPSPSMNLPLAASAVMGEYNNYGGGGGAQMMQAAMMTQQQQQQQQELWQQQMQMIMAMQWQQQQQQQQQLQQQQQFQHQMFGNQAPTVPVGAEPTATQHETGQYLLSGQAAPTDSVRANLVMTAQNVLSAFEQVPTGSGLEANNFGVLNPDDFDEPADGKHTSI
jgi:hypothetical protein